MKSLKYITILVPLAVTTIAGCNELQKDPSADIKTFDLKTNKRAESGFGIYADEIASENFRIRKVNGLSNYDLLENELKDWRDRTLSLEEIQHYKKIILALMETDRLMYEIDKIDI